MNTKVIRVSNQDLFGIPFENDNTHIKVNRKIIKSFNQEEFLIKKAARKKQKNITHRG